MITKRMIDEMDAKAAKDREEILKIAEEEGISYEEMHTSQSLRKINRKTVFRA